MERTSEHASLTGIVGGRPGSGTSQFPQGFGSTVPRPPGTPRAREAAVVVPAEPVRASGTGDLPQMQITMNSPFRSGSRPQDALERPRPTPTALDASAAESAAAGSAPRRGRAFRSLVLGYSDEESGDQVVIDVRGSGSFPRSAFLKDIERSGFTVLAEEGPGPEGVTPREAAG